MAHEPPEAIQVPLVWAGVDDLQILFANAFVSQFDVDLQAFILTVGQVAPPALVGTPDEVAEQAHGIDFVSVRPLIRLALTAARMQELAQVLQGNLDQRDQAARLRPGDPR